MLKQEKEFLYNNYVKGTEKSLCRNYRRVPRYKSEISKFSSNLYSLRNLKLYEYRECKIRKMKDFIFIETQYPYEYNYRYYFTPNKCFSCKLNFNTNKWEIIGDNFSNIIKDFMLLSNFKNELFNYWNNIHPEWKLKNFKSAKLYQCRLYVKMLNRLYKNPALSLVYNELGPSYVQALGQYTYSSNSFNSGISSHPRKYTECFNYDATNPRSFLNCNKNTLKWIKDNKISLNKVSNLIYLHWENAKLLNVTSKRKFAWNYAIDIIRYVNTYDKVAQFEVISNFNKITNKYNLKTSYKYFRYYIDAINMKRSLDLNVEIKLTTNIEYIKNAHDNIVVVYNRRVLERRMKALEMQNSINENLIKNIKSKYSYLNRNVDEYIFILPLSYTEFALEGIALNHCVASYADSHFKNSTLIIFQRKIVDKSLLTIELNPSNFSVIQHRGNYNRMPTQEESDSLLKYLKIIKIKNLERKLLT